MVLQKLSLVGFSVVSLFLVALRSPGVQGTDQPPDLTSLSDAEVKMLTIQLERTACYGTCPAYSVTIHGDGRVEYNGKSHVKEVGAREGQMGIDTIRSLLSDFAKTKFWGLAEDYTRKNCKGLCTDMPTAVTELRVKGITHRVNHYYGCGGVPKALYELESAIDKAANSKQWTGDVSKAGPFGTTCFARRNRLLDSSIRDT